MKAAICYEVNKPLVVEEVTIDAPGREEVKVKVAVTALCHSDLHFFKGEIPAKLPGLAGHETAGHIAEVGEGVTVFKVGDPVVVGTVTSGCGRCYYCKVGLSHFCSERFSLGKPHVTNKQGQRLTTLAGPVGGFAEYVTISQYYVTKIPARMPIQQAALLACGVTSGFGAVVNRAQVKAFSSVVVVGAGGVGMNCLQGARFAGADPIIALDISDSKLETARQFGATHVINAAKEKNLVEAVKALTAGRGADYVFVTVGSMDAIRQGFNLSGPRGMTVMIGLAMGNLSAFMPIEFIMGEKVLTGAGGGSIRPGLDIPALAELYLGGRLKLDELISGHYPLERINEAIAALEKGDTLRNLIMFE